MIGYSRELIENIIELKDAIDAGHDKFILNLEKVMSRIEELEDKRELASTPDNKEGYVKQ